MKENIHFLSTCILLMLITASFLNAQTADSTLDDSIFASGVFDQAVQSGKTASDSASLFWLGGLTLVAENKTLWIQNSTHYGDTGTLSGKAFLKATQPDISTFFVSYAFSSTFIQVTNDPVLQSFYSALGPSLDAPRFILSELHVSFDIKKMVFFRVGNQLLSWGASSFWSPTDFVNERQADSLSSVDNRTGKPGLRVHVPFSSGNFFLFSDFSRTIDATGKPQDFIKTGSLAFRADATFLGFNTGLLGSFGSGIASQAGLASSGNLYGFDIWSETGCTIPLYGYAFKIATSVGGEKTLGLNNEWKIRGDFFYNSSGSNNTSITLRPDFQFELYKYGKYYTYLSGSRLKLLGSSNSINLSSIINCSDLSFTTAATFSLNASKLLPLNFILRYNGGKNNREFTVINGGQSWSFSIQSILQF